MPKSISRKTTGYHMKREKIPTTKLYIRNFGRCRSRITVIEPEKPTGYDPVRIEGCSIILFNPQVRTELSKFYHQISSRPRRNRTIPGGIGSTADHAIKQYLGL